MATMARDGKILIYGATGYTGQLTAHAAKTMGLTPILAGRAGAKVQALAERLGLPWRAFELTQSDRLEAALAEVAAVLHQAGPFSATTQPMVDACLNTRTHYLDITGEIAVFEALAARNAEAKRAGIVLLPGVGFDVVPSDCLAAHLQRRLPDANRLQLYIGGLSEMSRGTAKSGIESIAAGALVRRNGKIEALARPQRGQIDFGAGLKTVFAMPWGDVSTAYHSTGIGNIEVYFEAFASIARIAKMPAPIRHWLGRPMMQQWLKRQADKLPEGPSDAHRATSEAILIGVATNSTGQVVRARLRTPEPYTLTAQTALTCASRVAAGEIGAGFWTPSRAFGADFVLGFNGVERRDSLEPN